MKNKSLFVRFFVSSIAISLLVVLLFGTVFYYFVVTNQHSEVKNTRFSAVIQVLNKTDYLLGTMSNLAYHLSSPEVAAAHPALLSDERTPAGDSLLCQQLLSYEQNLTMPVRAALFFRGEPWMYLSDGKYAYADFEYSFSNDADFTISRLYSSLSSAMRPIAVPMLMRQERTAISSPATAFIYPIPYMSMLPQASLLFFIEEKDYQAMLENYSGEQARNAYLVDDALQIIYAAENLPLSEAEKLSLIRLKGTGVTEATLQGQPMVVMRALSDNSGYSLIVTMHRDVFYQRIASMQRLVIICVLCLVGLSLLLALLTAARNLRPIRALLGDIGAMDAAGRRFNRNELALISEQFELRNQKNQELRSLVDMQQPYVLTTCITNILRGKVGSPAELEYAMQCANISFLWPRFQVLLITPLGGEDVGVRIEHILSACAAAEPEQCLLYSAELILEKRVAVIANFAAPDAAQPSAAIQFADRLRETLRAETGLEVSIAVGGCYDGLEDVHTSFVEALVVASEYAAAGVFCFAETSGGGHVHYSAPVTEQAVLYQALQQGDREVACRALERMVTDIRANGGSLLITQYQCFDIANTLVKAAGQTGSEIVHADLQSLGDYKDLSRFLATAQQMATAICDHCAAQKEQQGNQLSADVIRFVNQNFRSDALSLEQTAAHFALSVSYLSRFFKQATGRTFVQYVTQLRMDAIKEALVSTDAQIKDIVTSAGYIDVASFVRKFKTLEGITPGQYREQARRARPK